MPELKIRIETEEYIYEEYIEALGISTNGYSVVLRRDLDELFINPFNREWMKAWNANMDLQVKIQMILI